MGEAHVPMKAHAGAQPPWGEALGDNEAETQVGREGGRRGEAPSGRTMFGVEESPRNEMRGRRRVHFYYHGCTLIEC